MQVQFNGKKMLVNTHSLAAVLREHSIEMKTPGVAIAINGEIIFRPAWLTTDIQEGDQIEVVYAVQGG